MKVTEEKIRFCIKKQHQINIDKQIDRLWESAWEYKPKLNGIL